MRVPRSLTLVYLGLLLAAPAVAVTPLAPTQIPDRDVVDVLRNAYREPVSLSAEWKATYHEKGRTPDRDTRRAVTRKICADSGRDQYGPRLLAVCGALEDAGHVDAGLVDLWLLLDARKPGERPRVGAQLRNIRSGSHGSPGEVRLLEIGSSRNAFVLTSGYSNMGWSMESEEIYHAESFNFERLLTVRTAISNSGVCDPKESAQCLRDHVSIECKLSVDKAQYSGGFYALALAVTGTRAGQPVQRTIAIPRVNGAYALPSNAVLVRDACNQGF